MASMTQRHLRKASSSPSSSFALMCFATTFVWSSRFVLARMLACFVPWRGWWQVCCCCHACALLCVQLICANDRLCRPTGHLCGVCGPQPVRKSLPDGFAFDLERIIDDFIFMVCARSNCLRIRGWESWLTWLVVSCHVGCSVPWWVLSLGA